MNKLFTLCFGLMAALAVHAQNEFPVQFADKNGNIIRKVIYVNDVPKKE